MKCLVAVALVMVLAASACGAVGDLTPRACDPNEIGGGWPASMAGGQDAVKAAPAGCGTVHAAAKVISLRGYGPPVVVALDAAKADDKFLNVIRIDVNGTGKFTAETSIAFTWPAADGTGAASIGPATLTLVRDGRKVPVSVRGYATSSTAGLASLYFVFGTCLEGQCAFGDKVRTVRFVDDTGNFRCDDAFNALLKNGALSGSDRCDDIWLDGGEGGRFQKIGLVGQPLQVDGKWYDLTVSADQSKVAVAATKGPFGKVKVDADEWSAFLMGPDRALKLTGGKDPVEVPAGKYAVLRAELTKPGEVVSVADYRVMQGKAEMFEVTADKTAENPFGPPLTAKVTVEQKGRDVAMDPTILDGGGRTVSSLSIAGKDAGQFEVRDAAGKVIYSAALVFS